MFLLALMKPFVVLILQAELLPRFGRKFVCQASVGWFVGCVEPLDVKSILSSLTFLTRYLLEYFLFYGSLDR